MNVLLLGSGGREHALAWKIAQSPKLDHLYIAPGNAGTSQCGSNVSLNMASLPEIREFILSHQVQMLVVGPEEPLVKGIADDIKADDHCRHIIVIGPSASGARLEGSKDFAKEFMNRHSIPTAGHITVDISSIHNGIELIRTQLPPFVLKADGLAAGKGVVICESREEAVSELESMIIGARFGEAGRKVLIEQFLKGIEISVFVFTDGKDYIMLPSAKDYKRVGEGDTGLNTGGMGSISPVPFADQAFMRKVEERIIKPTVSGLMAEKIPYVGFIFFGLMNCQGDPYVIEYNVRMGDPEAESIIPRLQSDLLEMFELAGTGLLGHYKPVLDSRFCSAVMLVSRGYPGAYEKGKAISGLENVEGSIVFHAGSKTDPQSGQILTHGGRVLAIASLGKSLQEALALSYKNADAIDFDGKYFRSDLGNDLL